MANYFEQKQILRSDDGTIIATYDKTNRQNNGITFVYIESKGWGVVNHKRKETISPQFRHISDYKNGYAIFTTFDSHQGAIDENGNIAIQPKFRQINDFNENGIANVECDDYTENLINTSGEMLFPDNTYDIFSLDNGYFEIIRKSDNMHALANKYGKIITQFEYTDIYEYMSSEDLFTVEKENKLVVIDSTGNEITAKQDEITILSNNLIASYEDESNTLTISDRTGNIILTKKCNFDFSDFSDNLASFLQDYPSATVSKNYKVIVPLKNFYT